LIKLHLKYLRREKRSEDGNIPHDHFTVCTNSQNCLDTSLRKKERQRRRGEVAGIHWRVVVFKQKKK